MNLSELFADLNSIAPLAFLSLWVCLLLVVDLFIAPERKGWTALLAAAGLLTALGLTLAQAGRSDSVFSGMAVVDPFSSFLNVIFLSSGLLAIPLAYDYLRRHEMERGEYYSLLIFSIIGMMLMAQASNLIMIFLALEMLSIPLYILAGFGVFKQRSSEEAALKYFLLGAYASGFVVYGIALVFGATGTTTMTEIIAAVQAGQANLTLLLVGAGLMLVGLGFKVAAVPFHMWTPDVYQGAPTPVTAFMSVGAKAGGFAALLRIFVLIFPNLSADLAPVLWSLAALTMVLGNIVAIAQDNIKRLLAYSSIAHAGYILMALVPYGQSAVAPDSVAAALVYLAAYGLTSFTAWAVVIALEKVGERGLSLSDYAGLGRKQPLLAAAMAVAMLSFAGVPPTLGFVGKFYLFRTAIDGGYVGLALIGVITSLISAYYYLRVLVIMYMQEGEPQVSAGGWLRATAAACAVATVVISIFASPLFTWASQAVLKLM